MALKAGPEPLMFGNGTGTFKSDYMPEQAAWFREHPESPYAILADNSNHPFNEFLLIWIESGLIGLLLAGLVLVSL
ncbi:MAG: O-antigen ligase family protein, partial [Rikenellaceae bacterium]|nr:O-antigen ligase family protein [Rikenellaceae bacterium]